MSLSFQTSVLDFLKSSSGTRASPLALLDTGYDDPDDPPTVQRRNAFSLNCHLFVISYFLSIFHLYKYLFSWS